MINQQEKESFTTETLMAKNALLQSRLAERDSSISKLTAELEAAKFQNDQLRRMLFGVAIFE